MKFEWDENKNQSNIRKHGIRFEQAISIFDNIRLTRLDDRFDYGETRYISLGLLEGEVVIVVIYTIRGDKVRIISARKANKEERKTYHEHTRKNNR